MIGRNGSVLVLVFPTVLLVACQDVNSADVKTSGMYADLLATAQTDGKTRVRAALRVGGPSTAYVKLSPGDELKVTSGAETRTMAKSGDDILGVVSYSAVFDGVSEGKAFTVAFTRAAETSAPSSTTALPAPLTITAPTTGASLSRAQAIAVAWEPSAKPQRMDLFVSGTCVSGYASQVADTGTFAIPAAAIKPTMGNESAACQATITLRRVATGTIDPAFKEGGRFDAVQDRAVSVSLTP